jgi:hypothetical protein
MVYMALELNLQRDLDKLPQWEQFWQMAFHPDKYNMLTISRNKTPVKFKYYFHGHVLESVDKAKYLGVTISENLKWEATSTTSMVKPIRLNIR